jgi:hypothetical protein
VESHGIGRFGEIDGGVAALGQPDTPAWPTPTKHSYAPGEAGGSGIRALEITKAKAGEFAARDYDLGRVDLPEKAVGVELTEGTNLDPHPRSLFFTR